MGESGDGSGRRRQVGLSAGTIHYDDRGTGEPLVFVHGFGANGLLWTETAAALAGSHRCIVPDWPLGSHPEAMRADADLTPPGMARLISEFIAELGLEDVTVVGNDSGGAVCQILVTEHPERIARLVLTNCDCFEKFPPGRFKAMATMLKVPGAAAVMAQSMRLRANRRSPLAYGALTAKPIDDDLLVAWTEPQIRDAGVRRDGARFMAGANTRYTMRAAEKLPQLKIPGLVVWGVDDRFFTAADARRLADLIPDSTLVEIPGAKTFVQLDEPTRVADAIAAFVSDHPARRSGRC
jgi:pimeloyl-ACP methyl ester carboxylesterase